jgi:hypothetical protein
MSGHGDVTSEIADAASPTGAFPRLARAYNARSTLVNEKYREQPAPSGRWPAPLGKLVPCRHGGRARAEVPQDAADHGRIIDRREHDAGELRLAEPQRELQFGVTDVRLRVA